MPIFQGSNDKHRMRKGQAEKRTSRLRAGL